MIARFLDYPDAADLLGISQNALQIRVHRKTIPHIKDGRRVRFDRDALESYMRAHRVATVDEVRGRR